MVHLLILKIPLYPLWIYYIPYGSIIPPVDPLYPLWIHYTPCGIIISLMDPYVTGHEILEMTLRDTYMHFILNNFDLLFQRWKLL